MQNFTRALTVASQNDENLQAAAAAMFPASAARNAMNAKRAHDVSSWVRDSRSNPPYVNRTWAR
jgi:hypothetical protein